MFLRSCDGCKTPIKQGDSVCRTCGRVVTQDRSVASRRQDLFAWLASGLVLAMAIVAAFWLEDRSRELKNTQTKMSTSSQHVDESEGVSHKNSKLGPNTTVPHAERDPASDRETGHWRNSTYVGAPQTATTSVYLLPADIAWHARNTYGYGCAIVVDVAETSHDYERITCKNGTQLRLYRRQGKHPVIKDKYGNY